MFVIESVVPSTSVLAEALMSADSPAPAPRATTASATTELSAMIRQLIGLRFM